MFLAKQCIVLAVKLAIFEVVMHAWTIISRGFQEGDI